MAIAAPEPGASALTVHAVRKCQSRRSKPSSFLFLPGSRGARPEETDPCQVSAPLPQHPREVLLPTGHSVVSVLTHNPLAQSPSASGPLFPDPSRTFSGMCPRPWVRSWLPRDLPTPQGPWPMWTSVSLKENEPSRARLLPLGHPGPGRAPGAEAG